MTNKPFKVSFRGHFIGVFWAPHWAEAQRAGASHYNQNIKSEDDESVEWTRCESHYILPKFYEEYDITPEQAEAS